MGEMIHVSMAADPEYKRQLAVTLRSLASSQPPGTCAVTVLHLGIDKEDRRRIESGVADMVEISWIDVDPSSFRDLNFPAHFTSGTFMFRLLLPELLPQLGRTIYLDCDTVVLSSLTEIWERDLGDAIVGAVRDAVSPWAAGQFMTHWRISVSRRKPHTSTPVCY